jgi:transposase-like protein
MAMVRELTRSGTTVAEIARMTGINRGQVSQARIIMRVAPDLAEAVSAERIRLAAAYQIAIARRDPPIDLNAVAHISVTQMACLLHTSRKAISRIIRRGDLPVATDRFPMLIPARAARSYLASRGVVSDRQEDLMTPGEAAATLGADPGVLRGLAQCGELSTVRTPGGHRRYRASDVRSVRTRLTQRAASREYRAGPADMAGGISVAEIRAILGAGTS